jgi:polar amino acid transport system substrate-binding protein
VLDEQITTEEYGIAVSKNEPELTKALNQALKTIQANGVYQGLVDKWFEGKK